MSYPVYTVPAGDVLPILFATYDGGTGASITMSGLAVTDIEIYKDGSTTQRASDAGYTLLDTDGIDFDGITGIHGFSIDTGDNTDASFYTVGAWFHVVVSAITVDAETVTFIAAAFRIMAAESVAGKPKVDVDAWLGTAAATPTVAGVPEVDLTHVAGSTTSVSTLASSVADILVDTGTTLDGKLDTIITDTNELQTDWTNGGRLDLIVDAILDDTDLIDDGTSGLAKIATDVAAILVDTSTTLQGELDGIQADTEDIQAKIGTPAVDLAADILVIDNLLDTEVAAILADTNELQTDLVNGGRLDLLIDAIKAKTDSLTYTVANKVDANVLGIYGDTTSPLTMLQLMTGTVLATVSDVSASTTSFVTSLTEATNDHYNGRLLTFTDGALAGQQTDITDYNGTTKAVTVTALTEAPGDGDSFVIS